MNSFAPIDPALLDVTLPRPSGYPDWLARGDTRENMMAAAGEASREFPESLWIEPRDWADKARDNDHYRTWAVNYLDRFTNQDPTHECTCHMLTRLMESSRNRSIAVIFPEGPKKDFRYPESQQFGSVWLSPLSIYIEANPQQWGGASIRQVLEIACSRGALPEPLQPRDYGFKHTLHGTTGRGNSNQSKGPWVSLSRLPAGWQETSKLFVPGEVIIPDTWEQAMCLLLHGLGYGVGRNGHAVPWMGLVFEGNNLKAVSYVDSYDIVRYDSVRLSKSAYRGGYSIATMRTPDGWLNPAEQK